MSTQPKIPQRDERLYKRALAYILLLDMTQGTLLDFGKLNVADKSVVATVAYDEVTKQAYASKK